MEVNTLNPMDNFSNVPHIIESIFQHFNFRDLCALSEVCPIYNDFISNSSKYLNKFKLVARDSSLNQYRRNYQSLKVSKGVSCETAVKFIKSSPWKYLEVNGVDYVYSMIEQGKRYLQELEELMLKDNGSSNFITMLIAADKNIQPIFDKLKSLTLVDCYSPFNFGEIVIKSNESLKKLSVTNNVEEMLSSASNGHFRLEQLHISEHGAYNFDTEKNIFQDFLLMNAETLKVLELDIWACTPVLKVVLAMPNLQKLKLFEMAKSHSSTNWDELELPVNISITDLQIEDLTDNLSLLKCILKSCKNIIKLKVHHLNDESLNMISVYAPNVKPLQAF